MYEMGFMQQKDFVFDMGNSMRSIKDVANLAGVSGLMGAGRTEIMQAIFGNLPIVSGKVFIEGKENA